MFYGVTALCVLILFSMTSSFAFSSSTPVNVPVHQAIAQKGQTAELACAVDPNQDNPNVAWMDDSSTVLTFNDEQIVDDERFSASKLGNKWYLTIREVKIVDNGIYQCAISSEPIQHKYYNLTVFTAPEIAEDSSSPDVEAVEKTSVRLFCNATGYPTPNVTWTSRLADGAKDSSNVKSIQETGSVLWLNNVSRYADTIYTCTASNGFGSSASRDIRVRVRYKPTVRVQQKKHMKYKGEKVTLTCNGQGYRLPKMYFAKERIEIFDKPLKHRYTKFTEGDKLRITLEIFDLDEKDFGYYKCVAINSLDTVIKFIEVKDASKMERPTTMLKSLPGNENPTQQSDAQIGKTSSPELNRNLGANALAGESKYRSGGTHVHPTLFLIVCVTGLVLRL